MSPQLRKGSEVLVGTTRSNDNRQEYGKRAMELDDMIVKVGQYDLETINC